MNKINYIIILRRKLLYNYIKFVKYFLFLLQKIFSFVLFKKRWKDELFYNFIDNHKIIKIKKNNVIYKFYSLSLMTKTRYNTMFTKEIDTIKWIDKFENNKVFWDIGANVGIYTIYYAKKNNNNKVYCFEPSVFNLEILARNIFMNEIRHNTYLIPLCLNDKNNLDYFNMNNTTYGGALSGFAVEYDEYFNKRNINFSYITNSISSDAFLKMYGLPVPDYIKIDVDGIEHLILEGSKNILSNKTLKSVLVENPTNSDRINLIMTSNEFKLKNTNGNNQIWYRDNQYNFDA